MVPAAEGILARSLVDHSRVVVGTLAVVAGIPVGGIPAVVVDTPAAGSLAALVGTPAVGNRAALAGNPAVGNLVALVDNPEVGIRVALVDIPVEGIQVALVDSLAAQSPVAVGGMLVVLVGTHLLGEQGTRVVVAEQAVGQVLPLVGLWACDRNHWP